MTHKKVYISTSQDKLNIYNKNLIILMLTLSYLHYQRLCKILVDNYILRNTFLKKNKHLTLIVDNNKF